MIKKTVIIILAVMLLMTSGCTGANNKGKINDKDGKDIIEATKTPGQKDKPGQNVESNPTLGGISLGDTSEKVKSALGDKYSETEESDALGAFGEDITVWNYNDGISVSIGKTSGKVLRVVATSPDYKTDLGVKVGDDAETALKTYRDKFEEAKSRQNNETLAGWFLTENGTVVILDFDKSDDSSVNADVKPDSKVEEITLSKWEYYD